MKYFSMFTGIGGFELGIEQATNGEWECIGYSEFDKPAIETFKKHYPTYKNYGDCTKINPEELPDFDMLCGGFPCQAFSIAGKRRGFEESRGTLFFDIARILKVKKPKIVLLENVKGLLNHEKGETFKVILQTLDELGYDVQWMVLNSKFHGVPQNRERVFIIGNLRGRSRPKILPFREDDKHNDKEDKGKSSIPTTVSRTITTRCGGRYQDTFIYCVDDGASPKYQNKMIERSPALKATRSNYEIGVGDKKIRKLTPIECERLQGFPDDWTKGVSDAQRYKQCGNAVTVNVIKEIVRKLK